jgi:hypothetical protein
MLPEQSIQPLNVAAATLLVQLFLMALLAITSWLCGRQPWDASELRILGEEFAPGNRLHKSPTLFVALGSFAVLLISDELYSIWSPIFQGVGINTMSAATAISVVFILDLLLVGYLISSTGGSSSSPFLPALFTIPALAIFLRLPPSMFFTYAGIAIVLYFLLLHPRFENVRPGQYASTFMNIACLLLSMFTGYITRPVPITELKASSSRAAPTTVAPAPPAAISKKP